MIYIRLISNTQYNVFQQQQQTPQMSKVASDSYTVYTDVIYFLLLLFFEADFMQVKLASSILLTVIWPRNAAQRSAQRLNRVT